MGKIVVSLFLLSAFSLHSTLKMGVVVWYETHKATIAQTLCKNRDKPEMQCHGKCVLSKKLRAAPASPPKDMPSPGELFRNLDPAQFLFPEVPGLLKPDGEFFNHLEIVKLFIPVKPFINTEDPPPRL